MILNDLLFSFFLNKLGSRSYNKKEGIKTLTHKSSERKEKIKMSFNEALLAFNSNLQTISAPDLSVCYMLHKGSEKVRLIAYRYGIDSADLEGNGKVFNTIDHARAFAFFKGYIIPEPEDHVSTEDKESDPWN